MNSNNIYWERQVGNNCRIHSLNAFFSENKISESKFKSLCEEYDKLIPGLESIKMDGFAESRSIISFIVDKYTKKFVQLIPINMRNVHAKNRKLWNYDRFIKYLGCENGILNYFEFNKDHVWINRFINNEWYKIDSLSGVTKINKLRSFGENGYLLVFENILVYNELEYLINLIKAQTLNDEVEIAYNSLFHLLKELNLEYDANDSEFNSKITNLRLIKKLLTQFIVINRNYNIKNKLKKVADITLQLNNIFSFVEF